MPKDKENINTKQNVGGGDPQPTEPSPSSSTSPSNNNFELEELERAILAKYRRKMKNTSVSFIVYRLNAWKKDKEEEILHKCYKGLIDFDVDPNKRPYMLTSLYNGSCHPSRNKDPIFICRHAKVSTDHCVITRPNYPADHIMIHDNDSNYGTFVNGKQIWGRCPLVDGDIIGLGAPHHSLEDHWGDDKKKRGFVFKVRHLIKSCEEEVDNLTEGNLEDDASSSKLVVNNNVVLCRILDFLSHGELKAARLVSKFWKKMADPKIFWRSVVTLNYYDTDFYLSHLFNVNIATWEIDILGCERYYRTDGKPGPISNDENDPLIGEKEEKKGVQSTKIMNLLNQKGHVIRDVNLELRYDSEKDMAPIITMVQMMPNLETLRVHLLVWREKADVPGGREVLNQTLTLPCVKHFCIGGTFGARNENFDWENNVILQIAKLCPNIQKITSTGDARTEHVLRSISTNKIWTTGLNELSCEGCWAHKGEAGQREIFDLIHNLPKKLKKLELHYIPDFTSPFEIVSFENLLRKHSETLEHLVLGFKFSGWEPECILRFPTFPKLKILEFLSDDVNFKILFPTSGTICYESDFPEIKMLRLLRPPKNSDEYSGYSFEFNRDDILEIFIPKETDTVSSTMTWIEFGLEGKIRRGCNTDFVERFRRMFPHVHHPHLVPKNKDLSEDSFEEESNEERYSESSFSSEEELESTPPPSPSYELDPDSTEYM